MNNATQMPVRTNDCALRSFTTASQSTSAVTVDESIREEDRSDDEEKDEDVKDVICQLLN